MSNSPGSERTTCQEGMSSESQEPLAGRLSVFRLGLQRAEPIDSKMRIAIASRFATTKLKVVLRFVPMHRHREAQRDGVFVIPCRLRKSLVTA